MTRHSRFGFLAIIPALLLALPLPVLLVLADCCVLLLSVPLRLLLPEEYLLSSVLIYILLRRGACLFIIS